MLWLLATFTLALAPVIYFESGGSDSATESSRVGAAAGIILLAWLPLAGAFGLIRWRVRSQSRVFRVRPIKRAFALLVLASSLFAIARALGGGPAFRGDAAWTTYWAACFVIWVLGSPAQMKRACRR